MKKRRTGNRIINFFEENETPTRIHVGMRTIKTVIAVFICSAIGFFWHHYTLLSMVAAIICMQVSPEKSLITSLNRLLGTLIGGLYGMALLYICIWTGLSGASLLYYLVVSLIIIPIILTTLAIKKPSIAAFACIVFLSITMTYEISELTPWQLAANRTLDTVIGILAALLVNVAIPSRHPPEPDCPEETQGENEEAAAIVENELEGDKNVQEEETSPHKLNVPGSDPGVSDVVDDSDGGGRSG